MQTSSSISASWSDWPYRIGCPVWNCKGWKSIVVPERAPSSENLRWYSRMFNAVEGNSTFYGMPNEESFRRWASSVDRSFAFCFKFPQHISHACELDLGLCRKSLDVFIDRLKILKEHQVLGPTFLQLGPRFSGMYRDRLESFLQQLPRDLPWGVEVRHPDWFDEGGHEIWLDQLLRELKIDRVLFDSSPLFSLPPGDSTEQESQRRKPRSPFRSTVTAQAPLLRLIGRNHFDEVSVYWDQWSQRIASWILQGMKPVVFTHAPDDTFAPRLAREMHARIQKIVTEVSPEVRLPDLPLLEPSDLSSQTGGNRNRQLKLFEL